jgi:hypothetical protein
MEKALVDRNGRTLLLTRLGHVTIIRRLWPVLAVAKSNKTV